MNSITADEYVHLPVGYSILKTGQMNMDHTGSPPAARALLALPLLFPAAKLTTSGPEWEQGQTYAFSWRFMAENFNTYASLFFAPRMMGVFFGVLFLLLIRSAAAHYFGFRAGEAAALLFAFNPEMLAHFPLVTTDAIGAGFFLPLSTSSSDTSKNLF